MKITIIGTGYVGLVTGSCLAHMGNQVICVDNNKNKIAKLKKGRLPIYEPGLKEIIDSNIKDARLSFTTDLSSAVQASEFVFIAVGTPMDEDGSADLQHVLAVAEEIGDTIDDYKIIITKSTVPVGTAEQVRKTIKKKIETRGLAINFDMVSNPEFLKEGRAVSDFLSPDRIIIGTDSERARDRLEALYNPFCRTDGSRILFMDIASSELTKYAANAMLATRISFINEIAAVCETTGADVDQVRIGIGADNRIGRRFLFPGIGYGGSCFPKDVQSLIRSAAKMDIDLQILKAVENVNRDQKNLMVRKIKDYYQRDDLKGLTFAFWGLAFKPETDDVRESPSAVIIKGLLSAGAAIQAYDPAAIETFKQMYELPIKYNADMYACLEGADALVLATEWHHFRRPDFARIQNELRSPVIFDGRNQYDPDYVAGRGFNYISIGRRSVREANETAAR